jgi:3-dehydroquinate synthase
LELLKSHSASQFIWITDRNVFKATGEGLKAYMPNPDKTHWIVIEPGEKSKNLQTVESIYNQLAEIGCDRKTVLVALGGGVVGDITGFVAATYMRGVDFIQIPTTLLAMVDSSVGGKTGVNLKSGKNLVGSFNQPQAVWIDFAFLNTLPPREILCGLSEVLKYGCIWDRNFLDSLEAIFLKYGEQVLNAPQSIPDEVWTQVISRCCEIKAEVVSKDEKESNLRAILNYGHTFGHALEALTKYQKYSHGEAVAAGMLFANKLAYEMGRISATELERFEFILKLLPYQWHLARYNWEDFQPYLLRDKKAEAGKINWILNQHRLGQVEKVSDISESTLQKVYSKLKMAHA